MLDFQVKREAATFPASTSTARSSTTPTSFQYPRSVSLSKPLEHKQSANRETVSFVHISDPYADEPHPQPPPQPQQHQQQQPPFPPQPTSPQYVDVAATSLKAMIDPNLEQGTNVTGQEAVHPELREAASAVPSASGDTADTDHLNEAIRQALQTADEPVKDEFGIAG